MVQSSGNLWSQWAGGRLCGLLWSTFRSHFRASLVAQLVKNPPAMQETLVWFLGLIPGEQIGYSLQYFGLENSLDCIVHGVTESRTQLSGWILKWTEYLHKRMQPHQDFSAVRPVSSSDLYSCKMINPYCLKVKFAHSYPTLCDPMDYTIYRILQARILEWVAFPFSRGSSQPRHQTQVSRISGGFFTSSWVTRESQEYWSG